MMLHRIAHMENKCDELRRLQANLLAWKMKSPR